MSTFFENKACLAKSGRDLHFMDTSWRKNNRWKTYIGHACDDHKERKKFCLKFPVTGTLKEDDCDRKITECMQIHEFARAFNECVSQESKIKVLVPEKATLERRASIHTLKGRTRSLSRDEWILVVEKIGKKLDVFVRRDGGGKSCDVLEAFVHFTYHKSNGTCVVSKLRGTHRNACYTLSFPSLHNTDNDVMKVMRHHQCNSICCGFSKPEAMTSSPPSNNAVLTYRADPSAPPQEDSESDDEVFMPQVCSKGYPPQINNANLNYIVPNELLYGHAFWNDPRLVTSYGGLSGNNLWNGPHGQGFPELPPYTSICPEGHWVADRCGHYDSDANFNENINHRFGNLLDFGDTASYQQLSMNSEGL